MGRPLLLPDGLSVCASLLRPFVPLADPPSPVTFVCPTEILAFNERLADFEKLGVEVLAVSTDSEYSHLAWANTNRNEGGLGPNLKLKLVADKSMKIARDYGVLIEVRSARVGHPGQS